LPAKNITIDLDQRNGLYELVRNHLGSIGDFWLAMQREKDFDKAERLGLELAEDFRLLRDIGWSEYELHPSFELTMTPLDLTELLRRLRSEAAGILLATAADRRADAEATALGPVPGSTGGGPRASPPPDASRPGPLLAAAPRCRRDRR
jgi:hypothetical protein